MDVTVWLRSSPTAWHISPGYSHSSDIRPIALLESKTVPTNEWSEPAYVAHDYDEFTPSLHVTAAAASAAMCSSSATKQSDVRISWQVRFQLSHRHMDENTQVMG